MKSSYWLPLAGILSTAIMIGLHEWWNRKTTRYILRNGIETEGVILDYPYIGTKLADVKFVFFPKGETLPIECVKRLSGSVDLLPVGTKSPVKYLPETPSRAVLVCYAFRQRP